MAAAVYGAKNLGAGAAKLDKPISVPVRRAELRIVVTERGNLESVETVDGICEVQSPTGQIKIIQLVPEGSRVKKGDVVCRFDSAEIEKNIDQQEIKVKQALSKFETSGQELDIAKNKADSDVTKAKIDLELARLDQKKYLEGDILVEMADAKSAISLASKNLETAENKRDQTRELVRKGFRSPEQLRAIEQEFDQAKLTLERDQRKLEVKEKFEVQRKTIELQSKVDQSDGEFTRSKATAKANIAKANSELLAAKSTHEIEERQLKEMQEQLDKCVIKATQEGVVAYANEPWFDSGRQIREGATVYNRQKIYTLPDMTRMQVKVNVHESKVKKVKEGQTAEIRIDAFPNLVLRGKVKSVSQLADSNQRWTSGGAMQYATIVTIEGMPEEELRPSMTAEVRIVAKVVPRALVVPLQAVAEHKGKRYAYVERPGGGVERREIAIGDNNEKFMQVMNGLAEDERVLLDARTRADADFKDEESAAPEPDAEAKAPVAEPAPAPTSTPSETPAAAPAAAPAPSAPVETPAPAAAPAVTAPSAG